MLRRKARKEAAICGDEWAGAPPQEFGALAAASIELSSSDIATVRIRELTVAPQGVAFTLEASLRASGDIEEIYLDQDDFLRDFLNYEPKLVEQDQLPPSLLRFAVLFADGRAATSLGPLIWRLGDASPSPVYLVPVWSGAGGDFIEERWWLSPKPPEGRFAVLLDWPAAEIERARRHVDLGDR